MSNTEPQGRTEDEMVFDEMMFESQYFEGGRRIIGWSWN